MRIYVALAVVLGGLALPVQAEPLDLKEVSADAKWVVHVDVDALRLSTVMQRAYAKEVSQWKDVKNRMAAIRDQMCMDPTTDLHGITLYGPKPGHTEGVMLVQAAVDQHQFVSKVSKAPGYRTAEHGAHKLHAWTQADGPVSSAFLGANLVLLAKTDADVTAALDVLDGKSPSLAGRSSPLAAEAPAGTILLIRAMGLADAKLPFQSPLVKQSESLDLVLGENKGQSFSEARLVAKSAEVAGQVQTIIEGIRTTAQLQYGSDAAALRVIKGMKVQVTDRTVDIATRVSADDLWGLIEKVSNQTSEKTTK